MSLPPHLAQALTGSAALAALAGTVAYATINPRSQLFGPILVAPPEPTQIALTFDDGPNPEATPRLLDVLAHHNVRATFFLIGSHVLSAPALTREIHARGHAIGNHTMTHPWLPRHSAARIQRELRDANSAIEDTIGAPITLFRAPHGARRPAVLRASRALGLTTVGWNLIVGDWHPLPAATLHQRLARGLARHQRAGRGTNLVLHDGGQHTLTAPRLPTVEAVALLLASVLPTITFVTPPHWQTAPAQPEKI